MLEFLMSPEEALQKAIEACGGQAELARRVSLTTQAVGQWKIVPPLRVLEVERAAEGKVTRHQLRPDLYPTEDSEAAA